MQLSWLLVFLSLCLGVLPTRAGEGKRKLQIGVKKRVEHCPLKSRKGDVLHIHYSGRLEDGTEFDSSLQHDQPFVFSLGTGQVIKGWDQGLLGMCEGEKRKLVIPSELGKRAAKALGWEDCAGPEALSSGHQPRCHPACPQGPWERPASGLCPSVPRVVRWAPAAPSLWAAPICCPPGLEEPRKASG
ncbi:peptidyl-prolyl cis-trans isomerase FKBP2 isoform X1 [Monodelphis domestica]|uniref:peptidyl-prolyl cis-trans isomerase FKBP2 isoform X1 n=1 Tax=Monodelphis domestica TaxID=13616 RepID=UPI0024E21FB7|nr:peptidyl-prolyl cis-trans isomerase FKBP2 isoform X1 [Monodelphis domestica]